MANKLFILGQNSELFHPGFCGLFLQYIFVNGVTDLNL